MTHTLPYDAHLQTARGSAVQHEKPAGAEPSCQHAAPAHRPAQVSHALCAQALLVLRSNKEHELMKRVMYEHSNKQQ
jgi:hypothetical protein